MKFGTHMGRTAMVLLVASFSGTTSEAPPTCASLGDAWYFPNDCVFGCNDWGSTMDTDRSRNVDGTFKCYCVDREAPFCTDTPRCEDLGILPGTVAEDCARVCGTEDSSDVQATTLVEDNGYQFHYVVSCSCDNDGDNDGKGGGGKQCGDDYVLFSDLDYMKSCSGKDSNSLQIANAQDCDAYCLDTLVFEGGTFVAAGTNKTCSCLHSSIRSLDTTVPAPTAALACDDATARANDGSGLGNPCYEEVGVNRVDCPHSAAAAKRAPPSTTKTLVSSTAIMGVWLLPW